MTRDEYCSTIPEVLDAYALPGTLATCKSYGSGHINDTFFIEYHTETSNNRYILQRINHDVFLKPDELMSNMYRVTTFIADKVEKCGGNPKRETLTLVKTPNGKIYHTDKNGSYWRMCLFIGNTFSYDSVHQPEDFYNAALAFGTFQHMLSDFPAATLYETIPDFHNTPKRYTTFLKTVDIDLCERSRFVMKEINFFMQHKADMEVCANARTQGILPLRVTHNDTKLNNILIDKDTGKGLCVIDLDTVMPGLSVFDFGDLIRFGANTAAEDEQDLSKVSLDVSLFKTAVNGFLYGCGNALSQAEISMLIQGTKNMILECGMRFLTDYLNGDAYFRIQRKEHNLDRARTQIKLAEDFERKQELLEHIVQTAGQRIS